MYLKRLIVFVLSAVVLACAFNPVAVAQSGNDEITVTVVDDVGPVTGASVLVKGTTKGGATDFNGVVLIDDVPVGAVLQVSCIGYATQEVTVGTAKNIKVVLAADDEFLAETVVVGYGTMKKSSLTGSISQIKSEEIKGFPSVSALDALQGRASGVYVSPARQPGESGSVRIRGNRSIMAGNDPLLIIDGMPGSWENVASNDIESIEILKDAAATAIYGSRAANGVILVTTKSAKEGTGFQVDYNAYVGANKYNFIPMDTPETYANTIMNYERVLAYGYDLEKWQKDEMGIDQKKALEMFYPLWAENYYQKGITYDWQKALFNSYSFTTGHNVSVTKRTQDFSFKLAYDFQDDNSYYKNSNYQRHIISTNALLKLASWVDLGFNSRMSFRKNDGWPTTVWNSMRCMSPFETPWIDEDPSKGYKRTVGCEQYTNALSDYITENYVDQRKNERMDIGGTLTFHILPWLDLATNLKVDITESSKGTYYDTFTTVSKLGPNTAKFTKSFRRDYTWNTILTADKTLGNHHIMVTGVAEAIQSISEGLEGSGQNVPAAYMDYHNLAAATLNPTIASDFAKFSLMSYMGRIQYEYKNKYLFNAALRYDGSSRLAEGNQWKLFPSASVAWRISEEPFLKDNRTISNLKLRASYGEIGNQAIDLYQTMTKLSSDTYSWGGNGFYTWKPSGIANKTLTWEVSKTANIGLDFGLFKNKLTGSVEVYRTNTDGLLMQRSIPLTTGFSSIWQNVGSTRNQGVEAELSYFHMDGGDFKWSLTGTYSRNWNSITDLVNHVDDITNTWFIGEPISVVYDYKKIGIWQLDEIAEAKKFSREPGQVKVEDRDSDNAITESDKIVLGQKDPKHLLSFQGNFMYKNFDFSFNLVGVFGNMVVLGNWAPAYNAAMTNFAAFDPWTPLNPSTKWPRVQSSNTGKDTSTLTYYKGDFMKVQNMSLGYDFSSLLSEKSRIAKLRAYVEARNPFYIFSCTPEGINPEEPNSVYTIPSTFVFGVNLSF